MGFLHSSRLIKKVLNSDDDSWKTKLVCQWDELDSLKWVADSIRKRNIDIEEVNQENFKVKGDELLSMTLRDFVRRDPNHGKNLHQDFIEYTRAENINPDLTKEPESEENKTLRSQNPTEKIFTRENRERLPEYLCKLLHDKENYSSIIKWVDDYSPNFKLVDAENVAQIWGRRRNNQNMNYKNFSRALRYHYREETLMSVPKEPLVYAFGPKAKNLKTNNKSELLKRLKSIIM